MPAEGFLLADLPDDGRLSVVVPEGQIGRVSVYDSGDRLISSVVCPAGQHGLMYPGGAYAVLSLEDPAAPLELDPLWVWINVECPHMHSAPVKSGGREVARLCLACDAQLPAAS